MAVRLCWPAGLRNVDNNIYTNRIITSTDSYYRHYPGADVHENLDANMTQGNKKTDLLSSECTAVRAYMHTHMCTQDLQSSDFLLSYMRSAASISCTPQSSKIIRVLCVEHLSGFGFPPHLPHSWIVPSPPPPHHCLHHHPDSAHFIHTTWPLEYQWALDDTAHSFPHFVSAKWSDGFEGEGKVGLRERIRNKVKIQGREKKSN